VKVKVQCLIEVAHDKISFIRVTRSGHSAPHQVDTLGSISGGANATVAASFAS